MQQSWFDRPELEPLASRLRPQTLEEIVGQSHLLGPGCALRQMIQRDEIPSMIFWGPAGGWKDNTGPGDCQYNPGGICGPVGQ